MATKTHDEVEESVDYKVKAEDLERILGEERLAFMKSVETLWGKLEELENELAENDALLIDAWSLLEEAVRKIQPFTEGGIAFLDVDKEWSKKRSKWLTDTMN